MAVLDGIRAVTAYTLDLQPIGRRAQVRSGTTLLEGAQRSGVELVSVCGGAGLCGTCRVQQLEGDLTPVSADEREELSAAEIAAGWRLACQCEPLSDVKLYIPAESLSSAQRLQLEGAAAEIERDPVIRLVDVDLAPPSTEDLRADMQRLADHLGADYPASPAFMRQFAQTARTNDWSLRIAIRDGELIAALPRAQRALGLAVDIGTTGLAAYLIDLDTGVTLAKAGAMNPQIAYGEDVISRVAYASTHADGATVLQARLVTTLNDLVTTLCNQAGAQPQQVIEAVLVGNSAMHHLVVGLPVQQLGEAPYVPVMAAALAFPAAQIGLNIAPAAYVYLPPLIAGYVGADHVAMLLATGAPDADQTTLALDIGTNTEITLVAGGHCWSCSCASGPAFEGAHIKDGMRAAPGAVERIDLFDGKVMLKTIENKPPVGICGSGILDAVSVMVEHRLVNERGSLNAEHPLISERAFVLAPADPAAGTKAVSVTRQDVNEIQLAKSAIRTGIDLLLEAAGVEASAIESFVIAGAFGSYINVESAVKIGMFPALPRERFTQVGNAAGMGACHLLLSHAQRQIAADLVARVNYIELTTVPAFQDRFIANLMLTPPSKGQT
ncbi:MAG: DUF4445 domain-containing protein [Anaerolinea sp.]|nr:DUF4445 domain-containing protein [Anaerolinea sp.]